MESQKDERILVSRELVRVECECPSTDRWELAFDLDSLKLSMVGERGLDGRPRFGCFPLVVSELANRNTLGLIARNAKQGMKGAVRRLYAQFVIQNN